jgi:hypothetical protein
MDHFNKRILYSEFTPLISGCAKLAIMSKRSVSSQSASSKLHADSGAISPSQAISQALVLLHRCETAAEAVLSVLRSEGADTLLTKPELSKIIYDEISRKAPHPALRVDEHYC